MVKIMSHYGSLHKNPYSRCPKLDYYSDMDEPTIRSDLRTMLNDLFELEMACGSDLSLKELAEIKKEMSSLTRRIDLKRSILRRIEAKSTPPVLPKSEPEAQISGLSMALTGAIVVSLYWGHSYKTELEELQQSYDGLLEAHEAQVRKHNDLVSQANSLSFENHELYDENGKLKVANTDLEKTKEELADENAIAWRWYDRHTDKIGKLEEQVAVLTEEIEQSGTSTSAIASKSRPKWDYCVTQKVVGNTIFCYSGASRSDYKLILDHPFAPNEIGRDAVLRIEYNSNSLLVVGEGKGAEVLGIYLLDNDGIPERVKDLR